VDTDISLEKLIAEIDGQIGSETSPLSGDHAAPTALRGPASARSQYITFFLEEIFLAVPISSASEIGRDPAVTRLPNLPEWVLGVSNIRGEIISIVDLKAFMGLPAHRGKKIRRFIVLSDTLMKVGIAVDRIAGIFTTASLSDKDRIHSSPYKEAGEISAFISGVVAAGQNFPEVSERGRLLNILDVKKLLSSPRMTAFRSEK
jgi:purine-binding chemotaxis protein CheW